MDRDIDDYLDKAARLIDVPGSVSLTHFLFTLIPSADIIRTLQLPIMWTSMLDRWTR